MNMVAARNLVWVRAPVNWLMRHGWAETIWSIEFMASGLVSKGFLIDPFKCCLWSSMASCGDFQIYRQHKGGGGSDLPEIPWYFLPLVYSDEGFE